MCPHLFHLVISCEEVPAERTTNEIARRLSNLKVHWRLRWTPSFTRTSPNLHKSVQRSKMLNDERHRDITPSNLGMTRPHLIIEALNEFSGQVSSIDAYWNYWPCSFH